MDNAGEFEAQLEPELVPVVCVNCATEFDHEPWPQVCPRCQHPIDLQAQFAYCRGHNAFTVGQELIMKVYPIKRKKRLPTVIEKEGLQDYMQAYTSLQRAFQGALAESQRQLGIRMMAAIAQVFQYNTMVSPLEAIYWSTLLVELNSNLELVSLREKLAKNNHRGLITFLQDWRGRMRLRQLEKAMAMLDSKLSHLEHQIGFTQPMHTRIKKDPLRR